MDPAIPICLGIGFALGAFVFYYFASQAKRKLLRETNKSMADSTERLDKIWSMDVGILRETLKKIEQNDIAGSKDEVCFAIASFYHIHKKSENEHPELASKYLSAELREIERQAKTSTLLKTALEKKPSDSPML